MTEASSSLAAAFVRACALDVATLKPGNVSEASPGHRMTAALFIASADAAAPLLCEPGSTVGRRILQAVRATQSVANCNTNLGIVLLCAPIAAAAEGFAPDDAGGGMAATALRQRFAAVMRSLTVADADDAFRAIALAKPAGLGSIEQHDVQAPAAIDLRAAMVLAADRDLVARQYANDAADLFDIGLDAWRDDIAARRHAGSLRGHGATERQGRQAGQAAQGAEGAQAAQAAQLAMQRVYLEFLARFPDTHIARKHGLDAARAVSQAARDWRDRRLLDATAVQAGLAKWDAELKSAGLNPGTSADLSVATAFLAGILRQDPP